MAKKKKKKQAKTSLSMTELGRIRRDAKRLHEALLLGTSGSGLLGQAQGLWDAFRKREDSFLDPSLKQLAALEGVENSDTYRRKLGTALRSMGGAAEYVESSTRELRQNLHNMRKALLEYGGFQGQHTPEIWESFFTQLGGKQRIRILTGIPLSLSVILPFPKIVLSYKGLNNVEFENLELRIVIVGANLQYTIHKRRGSKVHKGRTPRIHPHVDCNRLCCGDGTTAVEKAQKRLDIIGLYSVVSSIMRTCNNPGAYEPLCGFTNVQGGRCRGCNGWIPQEELKALQICPRCHRGFCSKCVEKFQVTPPEQCHICAASSKIQSTDKICQHCVTMVSGRLYKCRVCKKHYCGGHRTYCRKCDQYACTDCLKECPVCSYRYCPDCRSEGKLGELNICLNCVEFRPMRTKTYLSNTEGMSNEDIKALNL